MSATETARQALSAGVAEIDALLEPLTAASGDSNWGCINSWSKST